MNWSIMRLNIEKLWSETEAAQKEMQKLCQKVE